MTHASRERQELARALRDAGPDAPTLCTGWSTRDLAAHLVVREHRPDAGPGTLLQQLPVVAEHTERVRRRYARRGYADLVHAFAAGPPRWSPFSLRRVDAAANLTEHFIHREDVRRARPGWQPRVLDDAYEEALWDALSVGGRWLFRNAPVGVVLVVPDGPRRHVRSGAATVVLTGAPGELLLHATGRRDHARVDVTGPAEGLRSYREMALAL